MVAKFGTFSLYFSFARLTSCFAIHWYFLLHHLFGHRFGILVLVVVMVIVGVGWWVDRNFLVEIDPTTPSMLCLSIPHQQQNRPAGPMARRLTTNQEIAGSIPA